MKLNMFLLVFISIFCQVSYAQKSDAIYIQPQPQQVNFGKEAIRLNGLYRVYGDKNADKDALALLKSVLPAQEKNKGFRIYIGKKGDKSVAKYAPNIPSRTEAYYLLADKDKIVIAGSDDRGVYYGVRTLVQLVREGILPTVEITDYPDIRFRGVVEGFYGTPWSFEDRINQLRFYGENKINTYIYGPKDDPYHSSPNWRKPYPEKEAAQLQALVQEAHANKVNFVWAIHPGQDIRWNDEDREALIAKFEKMYELGIRSFAVFFDDISGAGTDPEKQAELLNYIDENFVARKPDVTPLVMCPTEYNKAWSNPAKGYLNILGEKLNPSIQIMWTGDRVISDITREGLEWINERIKRPAYIWWNFPVSDYVRDHLLLGPSYGIATDVKNRMSGFVSNPMERAEASKIAIYSVADYAWNPEKYNSLLSWEHALKTILPEQADALRTFASHNSDLGPNGHQYRRDESVEIKPVAERFLKNYKQGRFETEDFRTLQLEFIKIKESADKLSASTNNPRLIEEIRPWLDQFRLTGETGYDVLAMTRSLQEGDTARFTSLYNQVKENKEKSFHIDQSFNQNPYQPGVKTATLVIQPFIDSVFVQTIARFNKKYKRKLDSQTNYCPHKLVSNMEQLKHLPLQVKTNKIQISPMLEVVNWTPGDFVTLELDRTYPGSDIEINLGKANISDWGELEISEDGTTWNAIPFEQKDNTVKASLNRVPLKAVRLKNKDSKVQQTYLRKFTISIQK